MKHLGMKTKEKNMTSIGKILTEEVVYLMNPLVTSIHREKQQYLIKLLMLKLEF